jgi:diguanylate cyclase (GGDEF)-like protein
MVYFMTVFIIAGFVYQPPWASALLFVPSGCLAAAIILRFHPSSRSVAIHLVNTGVMLFSASMFSLIVYRRKAREFMNGRIIEAQNRRLSELAEQDRMTGLLNHEAVLRRLEAEIDRARRIAYPLSIFLFDLDDFKRVNDEFGHQSGDRVLKTLSAELRAEVRSTDVVGRYGGEEFLVVMPATDSGQAARFAERFRSVAEETDYGEGLRLTVSGGIAQWTGQSASDLVRTADRNLYEAKRTGKNRIVAA